MTNKQKQCLLCYFGCYSGTMDGIWGPQSVRGEGKFREKYAFSGEKPLEEALLEAINKKEESWWDSIVHFRKEEFACKCGGLCDGYPAKMDRTVVEAADLVRTHFGCPAIVSSGLRCPKHNANSGGVSNSRHLRGKAVDFCVRGKTAQEVLQFVRQLPQIRYAYAINGQYVHMDVE